MSESEIQEILVKKIAKDNNFIIDDKNTTIKMNIFPNERMVSGNEYYAEIKMANKL